MLRILGRISCSRNRQHLGSWLYGGLYRTEDGSGPGLCGHLHFPLLFLQNESRGKRLSGKPNQVIWVILRRSNLLHWLPNLKCLDSLFKSQQQEEGWCQKFGPRSRRGLGSPRSWESACQWCSSPGVWERQGRHFHSGLAPKIFLFIHVITL